MITNRARNISNMLRSFPREAGWSVNTKCLRASRLLLRELQLHCKPTKVEFGELAYGLLLSGELLWELVLLIPEWAKE